MSLSLTVDVDVEWWSIFKGRTFATLVLVHVQSLYCMGMMIQIYQDKLHNLPKLAWLISASGAMVAGAGSVCGV